jgi:DNA helicase HerA-like ATPase
MKEHIGIVAPGSTRKIIIIYSKINISNDFVFIKDDDKKYIFELSTTETINEKLKDTEIFRIMNADDNFSRYNIYRTEALYIGTIENNKVIDNNYYIAPPGTKINIAEKEDIERIYDISSKNNRIRIGSLYRQEHIMVNLDFNQLFSTHASILGRTGSGKTYFIEKLLKKINKKYIVISSTNEYNSLVDNNCLYDSGNIPVQIDIHTCRKVFSLNESEFGCLLNFSNEFNFDKSYSTKILSENIATYYQMSEIKNYQQSSLFPEEKKRNINNIEVPRFVTSLCAKLSQADIKVNFMNNKPIEKLPFVLSTQEMSEKTEDIAVYSVLSTILKSKMKEFNDNKYDKKNDILIILEEAHNYAPSVRTTICKEIIVQIARVGRKYGLHLLILSQRPRHIDQTILSQCGTNFIFNLPNPQDVEYVMEHSYFYNEKEQNTIKNLRTGECLITSNTRNTNIICKISFEN